jgi:hypothetical protein
VGIVVSISNWFGCHSTLATMPYEFQPLSAARRIQTLRCCTRHILWLIEQYPEADISWGSKCIIEQKDDPAGYERAKARWLDHLDTDPDNEPILQNAVDFLIYSDEDLAMGLIERRQKREPENCHWPHAIGIRYLFIAVDGSGTVAKPAALKAMRHFERMLSLNDQGKCGSDRVGVFKELTRAAYEAGEFENARDYATQWLERTSRDTTSRDYGYATHYGNVVLGRLALRAGKREEARDLLLLSGSTPVWPHIDKDGPDMSLARDLLVAGDKESVLEFVRLCATFWKHSFGDPKRWEADIEAGRIPRFGVSLYH